MQVNPFQLNLNNQSVRELRIQAGQKAKVLLLSLLRHHLSRNVSAIHRGASTPHPPLPLSPLPITTPSPALPPALSSGSGHPNSSTAGLSHQLYGVSWCQLKELIRAAVCPCVWSQSGWEVPTSRRNSTCTDLHLFIVSSEGKLVFYFLVFVKVRVMLIYLFFLNLVVWLRFMFPVCFEVAGLARLVGLK